MNANTHQVGGDHYQAPLQHWDFTRQALDGRYLEGCVTKYVSRWRKKNGREDLEKASHYLEKLIEEADDGTALPMWGNSLNKYGLIADFCAGYDLSHEETMITVLLANWQSSSDLVLALDRLKLLISSIPAEAPVKPARRTR